MNQNLRGNYYRTTDDSGEQVEWVRMTTQESEFAHLVDRLVEDGGVPGPTELNLAIGRGRDNNLHGNLSKIRRAVFLGRGLRKNERSDRWERPDSGDDQVVTSSRTHV